VKSQTIGGTSFSINGDFVADWISATAFRIRVNQTVGTLAKTIKIDVKEGYNISALEFTTKCVQTGSLTIKAVYVDDDLSTNKLSAGISVTNTADVKFSVSDLNASKAIYLVTEGDDAVIQINFTDAKFTYTDTFTKPETTTNITTTWAFTTGQAESPTYVEGTSTEASATNGAFSMVDITLGDSVKYNGNVTYSAANGKVMTKILPFSKETGQSPTAVSAAKSTDKISFNLTPKKGLTFVPTKVSFSAAKDGTGNNSSGKYLDYAIACAGKTFLGQELNPNRIGTSSGQATEASTYTKEITGVRANSDNPCSLEIYIYGLKRANAAADNSPKSMAISDIVIEGYYYGEAEEEKTYTITTSVTPEAGGQIKQTPEATQVLEGTEVTFEAVPNTGYNFVKWVIGAGDNQTESTASSYKVESLDADVTLQAVFEARPYIAYTVGSGVTGVMLNSKVYYNVNDKVTLAANSSLYKEGYTQTGWSDGSTEYKLGETITIEKGLTLTPVFAANPTTSLNDWLATASLTSPYTLKWDLSQSAPFVNYEGTKNGTGVSVIQATYEGNTVDVAMVIDATSGKLNNGSGNAQANSGTKLSVPVYNGAIVTLKVSGGTATNTTINGTKGTVYTYFGEATSVEISIQDNIYLSYVSVAYQPNTIAISSLGAATLSLPVATTIPDGVKAYTGVLSESILTLNEVEKVIPAGEAVVLIGEEGSYKFAVSTEAGTAAETNDLVGNATSTEITPSVKDATVCVLDKVSETLGFYKWEGKIPAYKAYLPVANPAKEEASETTAPAIRVVFGDQSGNVTAIESIVAEGNENAPIYTISGRQVKNLATPGLYIQGGKKILVK
jgi:hypothetical protein